MKIFIVTMDDPLYTNPFFKEIITARKQDIVGLAVASGDRMKIGKKRSKSVYLLSLMLIMGIRFFISNSLQTIIFKIKKILSKKTSLIKSPSILEFAKQNGIKTFEIKSPNNKIFLDELVKLAPDVIINQSQHILKKEFLQVPKIGTLNRHNALLPKNRGRLTPFWVLFKGESETGVSIHFVTEKIDDGNIIVQERYKVARSDNFNTLVKKNYEIAPKALLKALTMLENGEYKVIRNDSSLSTYNTTPTLKHAFQFRIRQFLKLFGK